MQKSHLRSCCPLSKMERGPHHGVGFAQLSWREFRVEGGGKQATLQWTNLTNATSAK